MNKLIAIALVAFGLFISTTHAEDLTKKNWYIYNDYQESGVRNVLNDNNKVRRTISVVGMGSCKFSIKIHQRWNTLGVPKHCVPGCAFPLKVCGNKKCLEKEIKVVGSYTIKADGGGITAIPSSGKVINCNR